MQQRAAAYKAAQDVIDAAKAADRDLTADEQSTVEARIAEVKAFDEQIAGARKSHDLLKSFETMRVDEPEGVPPVGSDAGTTAAKSLGEHFVKHAFDRMVQVKGVRGASVAAPEFEAKAAADTHTVGGWAVGAPWVTDLDRSIVQGYRTPLTVASLLGAGAISGNAISYLVEGAREGDFTTVAEGAGKPQFHYTNPTPVTEALKKIAGFIKLTDEFIEDVPFLVSEINNRLLYDLALFEEMQLLTGTGTGTNLLGLLNRSVQTEASAGRADNADAVFRALTKISTATGLAADGIVINPIDYQAFRLATDANGQYYGGGFFAGQYGQGGVPQQPPLWGQRTVVTPNIAAGTVLVGAFGTAATLYRKGGIRVESTNSNVDDFTNNLVTIRAEERIALAVRRPLAFVKVTLSAA